MALIEKNFSKNKTDKVNMIRNLQKATRFLQRVCNEVKLTHHVMLSRHVPALKKCLEELIYRVKAMCAANNAGELFQLGKLKNRNIRGEEIISQLEDSDVEDEENEEEEEGGEEEEEEGEENNVFCLSLCMVMLTPKMMKVIFV